MNLLKFSNLVNQIVYLHPDIRSYHFGWLSDALQNTENNYNPDLETGKLYPHLLMNVPDGSLDIRDLSNTANVEFRLFDLQQATLEGEAVTDTLLEMWLRLKEDLTQVLRELYHYPKSEGFRFTIERSSVNWDLDSNDYQDNLISVIMRFTVLWHEQCNDLDLDFTTLPAWMGTVPPDDKTDYETRFDPGAGS